MVAIQIRDVPDRVRESLAAEAERRGQSLQLFLMDVLEREAASATRLRLLDEWERDPLVSPVRRIDVPALIRNGHAERDRSVLDATGFPDVPVAD